MRVRSSLGVSSTRTGLRHLPRTQSRPSPVRSESGFDGRGAVRARLASLGGRRSCGAPVARCSQPRGEMGLEEAPAPRRAGSCEGVTAVSLTTSNTRIPSRRTRTDPPPPDHQGPPGSVEPKSPIRQSLNPYPEIPNRPAVRACGRAPTLAWPARSSEASDSSCLLLGLCLTPAMLRDSRRTCRKRPRSAATGRRRHSRADFDVPEALPQAHQQRPTLARECPSR